MTYDATNLIIKSDNNTMDLHSNKRLGIDELLQLKQKEADVVARIPIDDSYPRAVDMILEHVHRRGGKLILSGMGKAGQIAANIATTFCSTGSPAIFLHPSEAQHGDLGIICPDDLLILISNSGKTREIIEIVDLVERLHPGIPYICITGNASSELAKRATITLCTGAPEEICPLGLTPTTSTTAMTVIGDLLVVSTMTAIDFTYTDYSKRHHGGYLGAVSRDRSSREK